VSGVLYIPFIHSRHNAKDRSLGVGRDITSLPTQYRLYGRRFLQVKRPNQQYQSTEGTHRTVTHNRKKYTVFCVYISLL